MKTSGYLSQSLARLLGPRGVALTMASPIFFGLGIVGTVDNLLSITQGPLDINLEDLGFSILHVITGLLLWRTMQAGGWLGFIISTIRIFNSPYAVFPLFFTGSFASAMTVWVLIIFSNLLLFYLVEWGWRRLK
jgi:hypothetical protein